MSARSISNSYYFYLLRWRKGTRRKIVEKKPSHSFVILSSKKSVQIQILSSLFHTLSPKHRPSNSKGEWNNGFPPMAKARTSVGRLGVPWLIQFGKSDCWIVKDFLWSLPWRGFLLYPRQGPRRWFHDVCSTLVIPLGTGTNRHKALGTASRS